MESMGEARPFQSKYHSNGDSRRWTGGGAAARGSTSSVIITEASEGRSLVFASPSASVLQGTRVTTQRSISEQDSN